MTFSGHFTSLARPRRRRTCATSPPRPGPRIFAAHRCQQAATHSAVLSEVRLLSTFASLCGHESMPNISSKVLKVLLVGVCAAFWFVHMTTLLQQIQVALAPSYYHQDQAVMSNNKHLSLSFPNKENKVMAFIRIPKTGSTSLLNVLSRTDFQNYNSLLSASYWHSMSDRQLSIYSCMFVGPSTFNSTRQTCEKESSMCSCQSR